MNRLSPSSALANRLTRHFAAGAAIAAAAPFMTTDSASAAVQYSAVNLVIPANIDGLYINVETGATGSAGSVVAGWDINPYSATSLTWFNATGTGMLRYPGATTGSAGNLAVGTPVSATGSYGSGAVVVGSAAGNWQLNAANRFGFRFTAADGLTHYGWGTMQVGAAITTRTITELAWETTAGVAIAVGDQGGPPPAYDPCATFNPVATIGANNLGTNQSTATNLDLSGSSCGFVIPKANYFKFTPPVSGTYTINTCAAAGVDTRMAILDGCAAGSAVLGCNDDGCGTSSSITISLLGTVPVYIVVGGAVADLPSSIAVTVVAPPDPACVSAGSLAFGANAFDNTASSTPISVKNSTAGGTGTIQKAVWYTFTPGVTGTYTVSMCGAVNDSMIAMSDTCPAVGQRFESIAYNDDNCACTSGCGTSNFASALNATNSGIPLTQDLVAGQAYHFVVGSFSATTTVTASVVIDGPPQNPPNPADLDGDGIVSASDLSLLLSNWGNPGLGDLDGDGVAGASDLAILLTAWTI